MIRALVLSLSLALFIAGPAGLAETDALTEAAPTEDVLTEDEAIVIATCLDRGAEQAECECGLDVARDRLTPKEMRLFAAMAPLFYEDFDHVGQAISAGLRLGRDAGFSDAETLGVALKIYNASGEIEAACSA